MSRLDFDVGGHLEAVGGREVGAFADGVDVVVGGVPATVADEVADGVAEGEAEQGGIGQLGVGDTTACVPPPRGRSVTPRLLTM